MVSPVCTTAVPGSNNQDFRRLPSLWPQLTGKTVVDWGGGTGLYSRELVYRGARIVVGIDLNRSALSELPVSYTHLRATRPY